MKKLILFMCVLLVVAVANAAVLIDPAGSTTSIAANALTVNDPTTAPTISDRVGWTLPSAVTGTATAGYGSFRLTWTGLGGWDATAAQTAIGAGTFSAYAGSLPTALLDATSGGDLGVDYGTATSNRIDPAEVVVITVDTDLLSGDLILQGLTFGIYTSDDYFDFLVYDSSANAMLQTSWGIEVNPEDELTGLALTLETGDQIYIASQSVESFDEFGVSEGFDEFRLETYTFDVQNGVPEPATLALLGLGGLLLRKRR